MADLPSRDRLGDGEIDGQQDDIAGRRRSRTSAPSSGGASTLEAARDGNHAGRHGCARGDSPAERIARAAERDARADERDLGGRAGDDEADVRDHDIARLAETLSDEARELTIGASRTAQQAAAFEALLAEYRTKVAACCALAADDRASAARGREHAARDRRGALADRQALAHALAVAETDTLTGARTRAAGLADLERELNRCERSADTLTIVYVDVIGLKLVNDTRGHGAGDALLREIVHCIRAQLRTYDLVVRFGGDEFVCALSSASEETARARFDMIIAALAAAPEPRSIRTGIAELEPGETAVELIARADRELLRARHGGRGAAS